MSCGVARQSARRTTSLPKSLRRDERWQSDADYIADQSNGSSWSSQSVWGRAAANKFIEFGRCLIATGQMFHDDIVADFGGNDGYASNEFYKAHAIKPLVVDCEPQRIDHAMRVYGLSTYESFLENMKDLRDKSIDWGFCSHTLEHTRDPSSALSEMARVVKRGCLFILPIEDEEHAMVNNEAHSIHADSMKEWRMLISSNGWRVVKSSRPITDERVMGQECFIVARPR